MNTNPPCTRCGGRTYRISQTCFDCGRDGVDIGPLHVEEWQKVRRLDNTCPTCGEPFEPTQNRRQCPRCAEERFQAWKELGR